MVAQEEVRLIAPGCDAQLIVAQDPMSSVFWDVNGELHCELPRIRMYIWIEKHCSVEILLVL